MNNDNNKIEEKESTICVNIDDLFDGKLNNISVLDLNNNSEKVDKLSSKYLSKVIGQEKAKSVVCNVLEEIISGVNIKQEGYGKPMGNLFFAGPSGVGKTLLAKVLQDMSNEAFGGNLDIVKINCADFSGDTPYSLSKLVGASAGYIGSDKKPLFHPDNIEGKGRVILFDEIEKGGKPFFDLLLSVLDDGTLDINYTEVKKQKNMGFSYSLNVEGGVKEEDINEYSFIKAYFKDTIIIMTSNIGNDRINNELSGKSIGFTSENKTKKEDLDLDKIILEEFSNKFRIEMQGRYDYIIPFDYLNEDDAEKIIDQLINRLIGNILKDKDGFIINFSESARKYILSKIVGNNDFMKFGGREIEKYFKKNIIPFVSRAINSGEFLGESKTSILHISVGNDDKISFSKANIIKKESLNSRIIKRDINDKIGEVLKKS